MTEDASKVEQGARAEKKDEMARGVWLTNRDRALLKALATVRYLSTDQIARMLFKGKSQSAWQARLLRLAGLGKHGTEQRYIRRLHYRTFDGKLVTVWALDDWGYMTLAVDGQEVPASERDVSAQFLEHTVGLNELYVHLHRAAPVSVGHEFRWHAAGRIKLEWREYLSPTHGKCGRRLEPDAILELPGRGKRLLIEFETGAHPVNSVNLQGGSTKAKLYRYGKFLFGIDLKSQRYVDRVFPDRFQPEVLFIVPNPTRQAGVNKLIHEVRKSWPLSARAVLLDELVRELAPVLGAAVAPAPSGPAPAGDQSVPRAVVVRFYRETIKAIRGARHQIRAFNQTAGKVLLAEPDYPSSTKEVEALLSAPVKVG